MKQLELVYFLLLIIATITYISQTTLSNKKKSLFVVGLIRLDSLYIT